MAATPIPPYAFSSRLHYIDESYTFYDIWRGTGLTGTAYYAARNDKVPLIVAAQTNDLPAVQRILTSGENININEVGLEGESALHMAAALGYLPIVEALLAAGANPSLQDEEGSTPIIHCARFCPPEKSVDVVKTLIAAGVSPLEATAYDMAPTPVLGFAIRALNIPLTQFLAPLTPLDYPPELPSNQYIIYEAFLASTRDHNNGIAILKHLLEQGLPVKDYDLCKCTDLGLTGSGVETSFEVLYEHLVRTQGFNAEKLTLLAPRILSSMRYGPENKISALRVLVEKYGVPLNNEEMVISVVAPGQIEVLQAAINLGLDLKTAVPLDTLREIVNGRGREPEFLQLIRSEVGLPQR